LIGIKLFSFCGIQLWIRQISCKDFLQLSFCGWAKAQGYSPGSDWLLRYRLMYCWYAGSIDLINCGSYLLVPKVFLFKRMFCLLNRIGLL
jgi:hypothetical protein